MTILKLKVWDPGDGSGKNLVLDCAEQSTIAELQSVLAQQLARPIDGLCLQYRFFAEWGVLDAGATIAETPLVSGGELRWVASHDTENQGIRKLVCAPGTLVQRSVQVNSSEQNLRVELPEIPRAPREQRLPGTAIVSSLAVGGISFVLTGSPLSVVFVLVAPLMLLAQRVGPFLARYERWLRPRRFRRRQRIIRNFEEQLAAAQLQERARHEVTATPVRKLSVELTSASGRLWQRDSLQGLGVTLGRTKQQSGLAEQLSEDFERKVEEAGWTPEQRRPAASIHEVRQLLRNHTELGELPYCWRLIAGKHYGVYDVSIPAHIDIVRAFLLQIALTHSPATLLMSFVVGPSAHETLSELCWVPHCLNPEEISLPTQDTTVLLVVVQPDAMQRASILALHRQHPDLIVLWVVAEREALPYLVSEVLRCDESGLTLFSVANGGAQHVTYVERIGADEAEAIARRLAPLQDADHLLTGEVRLPAQLKLIELLGESDAEQIAARWQQSTQALTVPIGFSSHGIVSLDLVADGPHALIAGTTGSGKSEFLLSWTLAMAHRYSPEMLNVFFIDFKGGATFAPLRTLPHQVGLVTDLSEQQLARVFVSLYAELRRRERLFAQVGCHSIEGYRATGTIMPRLVIMVDEFAAVLQEHPELVDVFIGLAQRGRSLGIHLVMATQRPAGVVPASLLANLGLRIAFRTADAVESQLIVDSDAAAGLSPATPGRAVLQRSHAEHELVQMVAVDTKAEATGVRILAEFQCTESVTTISVFPKDIWKRGTDAA